MTMSPEELRQLRSFVPWDPPSDRELHQRFDALGNWPAVAVEALRSRLQTMVNAPASLNIGGEFSTNWAPNIAALQKQLESVLALVPMETAGEFGGHVEQVTRPDYNAMR